MAAISFSFFIGLNIAGLSVLIGILCFILNRNRSADSSLSVTNAGRHLKSGSVWLLLLLPLVMNGLSIGASTYIMPTFNEHLRERIALMVAEVPLAVLALQIALLALGEEIAWRGFFQKQLGRLAPALPAILVTSIVFALGHAAAGDFMLVSYDLVFIFINSMLYGFIYHKTGNLWLSSASHFIANLVVILVLMQI
ncbi:CPBP family intramembrane glutamic endopeptidase [Bhargavaea cecembensis]|nr:CPBP family intramembrane glutamic endopeptidase [Bhargavaea cecembensis]